MIQSVTQRRGVVVLGWLGLALCTTIANAGECGDIRKLRTVKVALVQFDSVPEKPQHHV